MQMHTPTSLHNGFLGFTFEDDQVVSYFEVPEIISIQSIKITNTLLFDSENDQKNITHLNINSVKKSFLFEKNNDSGMLNF